MEFDFDTVVDRRDIGNMIEETKPRAIRGAGLPSYWGAEFDFQTAPVVVEALRNAVERGLMGFTLPDSTYLDRVAWWYETQRRCSIRTEWILPTHGTIFSLATAIRAFTREGEGIVMLSPGYMRYRQAADRLGRKTVMSALIPRDGQYLIDFEDLEDKMARPENRLLALSNPNNPTGTVWGAGGLTRIAELAAKYGTLVFSDEIFAEVTFGGTHVSPYFSMAGEDSASVTCGSLGKCFGLTGINHANVVIPNPDIRERFLAQRNADHYGSIDPLHYAALMGAYSEEGAAWLNAMRAYVWKNYLLVDAFFKQELPGASVIRPEGTYVLWIDFRGLGLGREELDHFLLDEALFCLDAGESYGGDSGFMRMNISVPRAEIVRSLELLHKAARSRGLVKQAGRSIKEQGVTS
jgi:cystathionine beta-lyase